MCISITTRAGRPIIDEVTESSEALGIAVLFVIGPWSQR